MIRTLALTLALSLVAVSFASADPLIISPRAFAQVGGQVKDQSKVNDDEGRMMEMYGVVLMGGGVLLSTLSYTGLANKGVFCAGGSFAFGCDEIKTTNWGVMVGGLSLTAAGAYLWYAGSKRRRLAPSIVVTPTRIAVINRITL